MTEVPDRRPGDLPARARTILLVARILVAVVLLASAAGSLLLEDVPDRRVPLPGLPDGLLLAGAAATVEALVALALLWPRPGRGTGIGLLLWCAATWLLRWGYGGACGCLAALGGPPWLVAVTWFAVFMLGGLDAVARPWGRPVRTAVEIGVGAALLVAAVAYAAAGFPFVRP